MGVEVGEIRAQIDRLIRSKTFETSEVHRRLLHYLAEKSIAGEADRLKEYTIGLETFGKPPTYDPKQDSIVRLQIGRLRQKLTTYYHTEGTSDPILISLPKGAFKLNFEPLPVHGASLPAPPDSRRTIQILGLAIILSSLWAIIATTGWVATRRSVSVIPDRWTSDLETLWAPFLQSKRPLLVCLGTPLFVRFPAYGFFRDPKANVWEEIEKSERITAARKSFGDKEILPVYPFTGAGEAGGVFLLSQLLSTRVRDVSLTRSNVLSWQQISDHDVIFVGPPKFNPQLQGMVVAADIVIEPNGIRNRKPRPGEPAFLEDRMSPGKPSEGETHALISLIPGLSGVGVLLVIAGNASPDTFAAAEWLTQSWRAKTLVNHLRGSSGKMPRYYQVVLKVAFRQGTPVQSSYLFHHVLDEQPHAASAP